MYRTLHPAWLLAALLFAAACGDDGAAPVDAGPGSDGSVPADGSTTEDAGPPASTLVSAEEGGEARSEDGRLILQIPPGALAEDTVITIRPLADADRSPQWDELADAPEHLYRLEPDGLEFLEPVTVSYLLPPEDALPDETLDPTPVPSIYTTGEEHPELAGAGYVYDTDDGRILARGTITHFSDVGYARDGQITILITLMSPVCEVGKNCHAGVTVFESLAVARSPNGGEIAIRGDEPAVVIDPATVSLSGHELWRERRGDAVRSQVNRLFSYECIDDGPGLLYGEWRSPGTTGVAPLATSPPEGLATMGVPDHLWGRSPVRCVRPGPQAEALLADNAATTYDPTSGDWERAAAGVALNLFFPSEETASSYERTSDHCTVYSGVDAFESDDVGDTFRMQSSRQDVTWSYDSGSRTYMQSGAMAREAFASDDRLTMSGGADILLGVPDDFPELGAPDGLRTRVSVPADDPDVSGVVVNVAGDGPGGGFHGATCFRPIDNMVRLGDRYVSEIVDGFTRTALEEAGITPTQVFVAAVGHEPTEELASDGRPVDVFAGRMLRVDSAQLTPLYDDIVVEVPWDQRCQEADAPDAWPPGVQVRLRAWGISPDGRRTDITEVVTWSSTGAGAGSVGAEGVFTTAAAGTSTVTATLGGQSGDVTLRVVDGTLEAVTLVRSGLGVAGNLTVPAGTSIDLDTYVRYSTTDGECTKRSLNDYFADYFAANVGIASVTPDGRLTGNAAGTTTVTTSVDSLSDTVEVTVTDASPTEIRVGFDGHAGTPTVPLGASLELARQVLLDDGTAMPLGAEAEITVSDPELVFEPDERGRTRVKLPEEGGRPGIVTFLTSWGGMTAETPVLLTDAALERIDLTPGDTTVPAGSFAPLRALGTYEDGSRLDITRSVRWTVSAGGRLSMVADYDDPLVGTVRGLAAGTATVTAEQAGVSGTTEVMVVESALDDLEAYTWGAEIDEMSPCPHPDDDTAWVPASSLGSVPLFGAPFRFDVVGTYADGGRRRMRRGVTFRSSDPSVFAFDPMRGREGFAVTRSAGSAELLAEMLGMSDAFTVNPFEALIEAFEVWHRTRIERLEAALALVRSPVALDARALSDGRWVCLPWGEVAWVTDGTLASIDPLGLLDPLGAGSIDVTGRWRGLTATSRLDIVDEEPERIEAGAAPGRAGERFGVWADGVLEDDRRVDLSMRPDLRWILTGQVDPWDRDVLVGRDEGDATVQAEWGWHRSAAASVPISAW